MYERIPQVSLDQLAEAAVVGVELALQERHTASLQGIELPGQTIGYIAPPPMEWK